MQEERLPKVCLREEIRNWKNGLPSKWMSKLVAAMKEVGDGEVIRLLEDEDGRDNLERRYCPDFKELKTEWNQKSYWEDKEQWAKMRCGNIGRAGNKGFKEEKCRLCNVGTENLEHAWTCVEMRKMTKKELVNKVEAEKNKVNKRGRNGWKWLLRGKVKSEMVAKGKG
ncbi:hypothetical protein WN51_00394 [Melipona quadrifasciata]|uniref:Uncharacterized protein n=1 Tax=Melipona quadrifasciata TaxID=166423 RepID=A0A0M9A0Q6_9HYME|nr:hypothetical protein WN51_00394 [Melipona quadrifasciata]